jgi:hypothetical protein
MSGIEEMQQLEGQHVTTEKDHEQIVGARSSNRTLRGHKMSNNKEMDRRAQSMKKKCT